MESNVQKMRESLVRLLDAIKSLSRTHNDDLPNDVCAILGMMAFEAKTALATPLRNCDVGTVEEQDKRFQEYCDDSQTDYDYCSMCSRCSLRKEGHCEIAWAQLPYKEDVNDKEEGEIK